ncbi:YggS family pyridoxal phosphate-dependent enzyme [Orbaceae bacterium ESL0721]|nr:YggS family pyridoxal phosphate-dependent enzyme [Orbaceae bacterium ESL0721]
MNNVYNNIQRVKNSIQETAEKYNRDSKAIELIAVSKTKPVSQIAEAIEAGQLAFGENYVQEGIEKVHYFQQTNPNNKLIWHFIGPLQSNKCKQVAENFDWMHTVDRLKIAQRLNDNRPAHKGKLNILIQINISQEESKAGIKPEQLPELAAQIMQLPNLTLRGLMAIPEIENDFEKQLATFRKMDQLLQDLKQYYPELDTLSMGMSNDMSAAIAAGSTMVRIGSAIFGARNYL